MAVETLDLKQLDENSIDIYEAVIKASRRARHILNERNYEKQMLLESNNINILAQNLSVLLDFYINDVNNDKTIN